MMAIVGTLTFNFQVVIPLLVKRTFDGDDPMFTVLFSVISVGSLFGALSTARRKGSPSATSSGASSTAFGVTMLAARDAAPAVERSRSAWPWAGRASPS